MGRVDIGGVGTEYEVTGEGRPVVLLHGFPDSGRLWRHQVAALAEAGFRVIVPDLRGYGRSGKPEAVEAYALSLVAGDILAILARLEIARAHVVGHDWGAALAWGLASLVPGSVDHLVTLSVGSPVTFRRTMEQREKSWYMLLFQFVGVAERWLSDDGFRNLAEWSRHPDMDAVAARLGEDGALTAALNWYRANLTPESLVGGPPPLPPVAAPTMGVWSDGDMALTERSMTGSADHVAGSWRYERIAGCGHWIPLEAPDALDALLLDFLPGA
jgi:pimeloyl-ACP methyl ester carboxylesterase